MNTPEMPFYGWNTDMPMSLLDKIKADLKQAMGPVMKHFGKLADGNLVRELLQAQGERQADL